MTARLLMAFAASALLAQANEAELRRALMGKPVTVRIDMPGSHDGVDLYLDRDDPMDWKQYSQRLKNFGTSIPKGRTATITSLVVKKDLIEVHLDGGGFGTFGDDTSTSVSTYVPKSRYEQDLERDIRRETDPGRKRRLESQLSSERSRRYREERRLRAEAEAVSAIKRQEVMEKRLRGGSRFNLRHLIVPADANPDQVMQWLREYADFSGRPMPGPGPSNATGLRRGMPMEEVRQRYGRGRLISESAGADGLQTQVWEFLTNESRINVTAVDGLVVRYAMNSR